MSGNPLLQLKVEDLVNALIALCPAKEEELKRIHVDYKSDVKEVGPMRAKLSLRRKLIDTCGIMYLAAAMRQTVPGLCNYTVQGFVDKSSVCDHALLCEDPDCDEQDCKRARFLKKSVDVHVRRNFLPPSSKFRLKCKFDCKVCTVSMMMNERWHQLTGKKKHRSSLLEEALRLKGKAVKDLLVCPVTLETIQKPVRITICDHVFDSSSLESVVSDGVSRCPMCRIPFSKKFVDEDREIDSVLRRSQGGKKRKA